MAAGAFTVYDAFKLNLLEKAFNFASDSYNVVLATASYSPSVPTDSTYANVSGNEVAAGNGYSTGGVTLSALSLYYALSSTTLPAIAAAGSGYPASSTFNVTLSGGTSTTAGQVNVTSSSGGAIASVNSVSVQGAYSALPSNPCATSYGTGSGLTLTNIWDVAFTAGAVSWSNSSITAKYAVLIHRAGGSLVSGDLLVGYVDLNSGGGAISSTNATFQINWNTVGLFTLE